MKRKKISIECFNRFPIEKDIEYDEPEDIIWDDWYYADSENFEEKNIRLIRCPEATAVGLDQHIVRHSPTGIEWGYGGSGPADLALSILTQYAGQEFADCHYMQFKFEVIANIPRMGGMITAEKIEQWIDNAKA